LKQLKSIRAPAAMAAPTALLSVRQHRSGLRQRHPGACVASARCAPRFRSWRCSAPNGGRQIDDAEGDLRACSRPRDGEVTRGEILFDGERINGIDPTRSSAAASFSDGGPPHHRRHDVDREFAARLPFTRNDREIDADIDMVSDIFHAERSARGLGGYLPPAASSRCWRSARRLDGAAPKMILMDRAVDGAVAAARERSLCHHPGTSTADLGRHHSSWWSRTRGRALGPASHGLHHGNRARWVLERSADELRDNRGCERIYLGGAGDQRKSFKNPEKLQAAGNGGC